MTQLIDEITDGAIAAVPCPLKYCEAPIGEYCKTPSGKESMDLHRGRYDKYIHFLEHQYDEDGND